MQLSRNPVWDQGVRAGEVAASSSLEVRPMFSVVYTMSLTEHVLQLVVNPLSQNPLAVRQIDQMAQMKRRPSRNAHVFYDEREEEVVSRVPCCASIYGFHMMLAG